jgi:hypothetical protein
VKQFLVTANRLPQLFQDDLLLVMSLADGFAQGAQILRCPAGILPRQASTLAGRAGLFAGPAGELGSGTNFFMHIPQLLGFAAVAFTPGTKLLCLLPLNLGSLPYLFGYLALSFGRLSPGCVAVSAH